ncbi:phosphoinositide-3-kinase, regulatory subunit 4 [Homalodisca vitripennis]|nr:phosphoinositide-3-kinase, regulatory subunit 4 [Homalodisca vitripennis]
MGNQLVGIAPSQIFPVEHYLTDHTDLQYDMNLGSTRFFKVARARSQEGLIVVKVFAIHDPTLPLSMYRDRIEEIRNRLASANNCLPSQRVILTDRAGFLMRGYIKYSLYDRISTRPFLTSLEKKWIAFQLLYALHQCHRLGICHGDVKLENILVTSWHWVLLSDFASFKPTHLPEDNPADFSYFFDTSRRRTCYIAPERFIKSLASDMSQLLPSEENIKKGDLTPAMDIFSAGCCLIELFTDGQPPFDFSQLLAYRSGEFSVDKHLEKIEDTGVRALVRSMVQREAGKRLSAEDYLSQERGKVFPDYFYTFLQSYMLIFSSSTPILSPDEKIERLKKDIKNIVNMMRSESVNQNKKEEKQCSINDDPLVIITSLVLLEKFTTFVQTTKDGVALPCYCRTYPPARPFYRMDFVDPVNANFTKMLTQATPYSRDSQVPPWGKATVGHSLHPHTLMKSPPFLMFSVNPLRDSPKGFRPSNTTERLRLCHFGLWPKLARASFRSQRSPMARNSTNGYIYYCGKGRKKLKTILDKFRVEHTRVQHFQCRLGICENASHLTLIPQMKILTRTFHCCGLYFSDFRL